MTLIEPSEWARRRRIILDVRASSELDGVRSSDDVRALQDRWVDGEISLDELRNGVLELTRIDRPSGAGDLDAKLASNPAIVKALTRSADPNAEYLDE